MTLTDSDRVSARRYGTAEHAAKEAVEDMPNCHEGYVSSDSAEVAESVVEGLRVRGFVVTNEPRCECGWLGAGNHYHDTRMGRAEATEVPS